MQRWIRNWLHKAQCIVNDGSLWGAAHCCESSLIECCRLKEIHGLSKEVSGIPIWDLLVYASCWRSRMLVLNLRKQSFQSEDGDFGLCQVATAAGIFLVLETPSAEVECCSVCLIKDLEAGCGGLCSWWGSSVHSLDKQTSSGKVACAHPPHTHSVYEDDKKVRPLGTHCKTEGSQLAEPRPSWLLFWRNFWKLARFMDSCRLPALFSSASKCSFELYFFLWR